MLFAVGSISKRENSTQLYDESSRGVRRPFLFYREFEK